MRGDIIQDKFGWYFSDKGDGTAYALSEEGGSDPSTARTIATAAIEQPSRVLVRNGAITGEGGNLAARAAMICARNFA